MDPLGAGLVWGVSKTRGSACLSPADRHGWAPTTRAGLMQWTVRLEARTDRGEVETTELVTIRRPAVAGTFADLGLALAEAKAVLAKLQRIMVQSQAAEYVAYHRVCPHCRVPRPLKDRRSRRLRTLFGTVEMEAPRYRVCRRCPPTHAASGTFSPVCALLPARGTPELARVEAELGARTSFREVARILETLLPVSPANHEGVRARTHAAALRLEAADRQAAAAVMVEDTVAADVSRPIVMLDGAYVRAALLDQGSREGSPVTAISDGDPTLPALVRSTVKAPVESILDWFHLSVRVRHVEQTLVGLAALEPVDRALLERAQVDVQRLRHCSGTVSTGRRVKS
jgi:hypothetical protein